MTEISKVELLEDLKGQVKVVCEKRGIPRDIRKAIMAPNTILIFYVTVLYKGKIVTVPVIRVQHFLPSGGGCRIALVNDMSEALSETEFLGALMSLKFAIAGEEFIGGGKALVNIDPENTPRDLRHLLFVRFGEMMAPFMLDRDRIAPDMGTNWKEMRDFLEGVTNILGGKVDECEIRALATGKELDGTWRGGIPGRSESTGYGVAFGAKLAAEKFGFKLKGATVVVDGFGKVGIPAAERMIEYGATVIAVSDSKGGIVNRSGLDIEELKNFKKKTGTVVNFPGSYFISKEKLLEIDCDILLPCAKEGKITEENVCRIKVRFLIGEGSNMGITGRAKRILSDKGIIVLDGIFANLAGAITSIKEADDNRSKTLSTFEEAVDNFEGIMEVSFNEIFMIMKKYSMNLPDATLALGIERLIKIRFGKTLEELLAERKDC
jgi:glutamate dehydrogenase/leucine dehydrogenase